AFPLNNIFISSGKARSWGEADNMGKPFNSSVDDFYYVATKDSWEGFVVSNRPGGHMKIGETCCDDIYRFHWPEVIKVEIEGFVFQEGDTSRAPINGSQLQLFNTTEGEKRLVNGTFTFSDKHFRFPLDTSKTYLITAKKEGYLKGEVEVSTKGITESKVLYTELFLKKLEKEKTFVLKNIYYKYDEAAVTDQSLEALQELYNVLEDNPNLHIEIGAHTDSKGASGYNEKLSQRRAEKVVMYLVKKGIAPARLKAKGYGESVPLVPNENPDGSDNPENRQKNRRTEIKIISNE
ncbi:MAG: OmpA family protein, partial [Bacteroidetes bacterium]|nr:OmpA family protein [Bacteroidota bacterium]